MIHLLLVSALCTAPQDPPPAEARPQRQPTPVLLDSVQLIVNDICITIGDLQRRAAQQGKPATSREEYVRMLEESADELIRQRLMEQAGRDLGYDENMVRAMVRSKMKEQVERFGSVAALAEELDRAAFDSLQLKEDIEDRTYRELWQLAVTGHFAGPGGRQYVDRFVRPGQILLEFERQGASLDLPTKIQLEEMIIAPQLGETPESARQRAQLVRSRLAQGEDFYELNDAFGIPGRDPELEPIEEDKLAVVPEVKAFVDAAAPGDVSEVIPILRNGQLAGFRILRFVGRQAGKAASFVDRQFQTQLTSAVRQRRDQAGQERALMELREAAYVWPSELVSAPRGTGEEPPREPAESDPAQAPGEPAGAPPGGS